MLEIVTSPDFDRALKKLKKRYRSMPEDYSRLLNSLEKNPYEGIDLGHGLRKVRVAIASKGKGKSHGARAITYIEALVSVDEGVLILLYIYDKAEYSSISDEKLRELVASMK
ncbi:hypothetical protein [Bacteroides timonensis]|uniref:hypothetical protein n=1 Tax=Bacteroides timonensis TaxID=1470345 RepID=UPI0005C6435B|nr:hypothetical protein [Bacteroides timonensis]